MATTEAPKAASGGKAMNKMEAVRKALADLGSNAKPIPLRGHIKDKYGIEMSTAHISDCKKKIAKEGRTGRPEKKQAAPAAKPPAPAAPQASANGSRATNGQLASPDNSVSLSEQVALLKRVAQAIGKDEAKKILDLL